MKDLDWIGTWSQGITELAILQEEIDNQTLRMVVQLSLGGEQLCARLSNMFGHDPVSIDAGHVALAGDDGTLIPGTGQPLLFSGQPTVIIPAKGEVASDSVDLATLAGTSLAVSLYFPQPTKLFTGNFPGIPIYRCQGSAADGKEQPFVPVAIREVVPGRTIPPTAPF
jgi:hypothetical protein